MSGDTVPSYTGLLSHPTRDCCPILHGAVLDAEDAGVVRAALTTPPLSPLPSQHRCFVFAAHSTCEAVGQLGQDEPTSR